MNSAKTYKDYYSWKKTPSFKRWREKQFLKQGGLCWYCADFLPMTKQNVEHKTAMSLGGSNNRQNLVLSCSSCNKAKGSTVLTPADRTKYNKQNTAWGGTYLKNKEHFDNLYGQYSDESFADMVSNF